MLRRSAAGWAQRAACIVLAGLPIPMVGGAAAAAPWVDYAVHCMGCHLADGRGFPDRVPALTGSVGRFLRLPEGRAFLVRVPGTAHAPLGDAELAALLNWLVVEFSPDQVPADFEPYTAEEVSRLRRQPLSEVDGVRRELLRALDSAP